MYPILFEVPLPGWAWLPEFIPGSIPIRAFSVMVLLGVIAGALYLKRRLPEIGITHEGALDQLVLRVLLLGFILARMTYVAVHPDVYHSLISLVAVWEGGIVSYGGFFGGALGAWFFARKCGVPFVRMADAGLPALALGQVFGRIGCLLVGDDHGAPWDGAWAVTFSGKEQSLIPPELVGVPLHPSQIYLSLMNLVIFGVAAWMWKRRRFDGQVAAVTMGLYAVGRFTVEFTRGDDAARGIYGAFSTSQWISLGTAALAVGLLVVASRRPRIEAA